MLSIENSNCPVIEYKNQVRRMFYQKNTKKNDFTDLATESSDSVASQKQLTGSDNNKIKS